jgi:hypothetical protein
LLTVIGVGAILLESKIPLWTAALGGGGALVLLVLAVVITPEERN